MSVSVEKVLNPGLSFLNSSKNEVMPITIGSAGTTTYVYEPISTNQSTTVWNFKQPYGNAVAKKQWFVKMVVQVQTPNDADATYGKNFCPRAFAPMAGCRFAELKWNGKTSSFNPSEYLDPLTRFYLTDEQREQEPGVIHPFSNPLLKTPVFSNNGCNTAANLKFTQVHSKKSEKVEV